EALPLDDQREARPHLDLLADVFLRGVHRDRRAELGEELLDERARLAESVARDPLLEPRAVLALQLLGELGVEPALLAGLPTQVLLRVADLHDLGVGELE